MYFDASSSTTSWAAVVEQTAKDTSNEINDGLERTRMAPSHVVVVL